MAAQMIPNIEANLYRRKLEELIWIGYSTDLANMEFSLT